MSSLTVDDLITFELAQTVSNLRTHSNARVATTAKELRRAWKSLAHRKEKDTGSNGSKSKAPESSKSSLSDLQAILSSTSHSSDVAVLLNALTELNDRAEPFDTTDFIAHVSKLRNHSDASVAAAAKALRKKWKNTESLPPTTFQNDPVQHLAYLRTDILEKASSSTATKLAAISELARMKMTLDLVISSKIGRTISTLRKSTDASLAAAAKKLRAQWKQQFSDSDSKE